jgi:ketosteroid isomerase-like protein
MKMQSTSWRVPLAFWAAAFLGLAEPLRAQPKEPAGAVESEILKLEAALNQAVVTGDVITFGRLFAEDFTHTSQNGRSRTKAQWLKGKQQGQSNYVSFDVAETAVRVLGDSAVVTGISTPVWREDDGRTATGRYRYLRLWAKRGDLWQVVAFQATDAAEKAPAAAKLPLDEPKATKSFEIRDDKAVLDGHQIKLWGIRCGNALMTQAVTERHVRNLDNMIEHGINCIGVYIQGSNGGWPDAEAGVNGYASNGALKPEFAERLEWLVREADRRGMAVMVGLFSPRKDQEFADEAAVQRACEETAKFLSERQLKNVFVDLMHEYNHERIDMDLFREPNGEEKKAKLTRWFKKFAPDIEAGVCPTYKSGTGDSYPGMEVRMIQKEHAIPASGYVVNVEMQRHDPYENDGKFEPEEFDIMQGYFRAYQAAPNAAILFHSAYIQGITNKSGTAPHAEMGGYGRSEQDRGVRFYYEWVRDNVGRWEYPRHIKAAR